MNRIQIQKYALPAVAALVLYAILVAVVARTLPGALGPAVVLLPVLLALGWLVVQMRRRTSLQLRMLQGETAKDYRQLEALAGVHASLDIQLPLPAMRGWAASPDFLAILTGRILASRPKVVVELGSGVSTLVTCYALKKLGGGAVYSLDHNGDYAKATEAKLTDHGLAGLARVIEAPLGEVTVNGATHTWYDTAKLAELPPIDLIVVDGPPNISGDMPRYPALPLLAEKLNPDAYILIDDGARVSETAMVERWKKEFSLSKVQYIETEKGTFVLRYEGPSKRQS